MALQDLVRFLLPRDEHFFVFLEKQASIAHEAATVLAAFGGGEPAERVQPRLEAIELEGDEVVVVVLGRRRPSPRDEGLVLWGAVSVALAVVTDAFLGFR